MQKHEVLMMQWLAAIASVLFGLLLSFSLAGHIPFPFPAGIVKGFVAAIHNPLLFWGVVPGAALAFVLVRACPEYLFNGFEGYRYARFIRGVKMENWHQLSGRIRAHNNKYRKQAVKHGDAPRPP